MPKVSVVVPIYNVEKYIARCARSLFEQSLDDIEFVFVDDCTPDNSIEILQSIIAQYPNRRNQIKIIRHTENRGLPMARKSGIENTTGDFIIQCDSDDWVDKEMYETMYNEAIKNRADVVVCGYQVTDGENYIPYVICQSTEKELFIQNCLFQKESASLCSKLFRKDLFRNEIIYPIYGMGEDIALCLQLVCFSKKIYFIPKPFYYYFNNQNSISKHNSVESVVTRFEQAYNNVLILEKFFRLNSDIGKNIKLSLDCFKHKQRDLLLPVISKKEYFKLWKTCFKDINKKVVFMPLNLKDKIFFLLRITRIFRR